MPVEVNLLEDGGVEILAKGVVSGEEIIKANEQLVNDEGLKNIRYKLIDKSACTEYVVSAAEIKKVAELNRVFAEANPGIVVAIVESRILQFSLTGLWQAIVKKWELKNNNFYRREAALEWVAENRQPETEIAF
ncbi:MAG: hypothetical protein OQK72_05155 [Gammaproteobacteria bacterium]|nr:hypothetical protein [Gammaproteobacteria bacterium]